MASKKIPAGKFKDECFQIMEKVRKTRRKIIITKGGEKAPSFRYGDESSQNY